MLVSKGTDYAVRAMIDLASSPDGERTITEDIAERQEIPVAFLSKVLARLSQAGLVRASRGAAGGVSLARPAEEISLLDIIEAVQGPLVINTCTDPYDHCDKQEECGAHTAFLSAQRSMERIFRDTKLADMVNGRKQVLRTARAS